MSKTSICNIGRVVFGSDEIVLEVLSRNARRHFVEKFPAVFGAEKLPGIRMIPGAHFMTEEVIISVAAPLAHGNLPP